MTNSSSSHQGSHHEDSQAGMHPRRSRSGLSAYRRTGLALIVFIGTSVALLVTAPGGASADTPTPAAFYPGISTATASGFGISPTTAGLGYTLTFNTSDAEYEEGLAKALSQTLNLGSIGTSLTSTQCDGSAASVKSSQLPQPASVESNAPPSSQTITLLGTYGGSGAGAGIEHVAVTPQPSATATTKGAEFNASGAIVISGSQSTAESQVIGGLTRDVQSSSDVGQISLLGGLVVLSGLHWAAAQQSGTVTASSGSFSIGTIELAGVPLSAAPDQVATSIAIVNTALSPVGFHITMPQVVQTPDSHDGNGSTSQVTSMMIGIDNSALGRQVIGSQLITAQPLRNALVTALLGANCKFGTAILLSDIGVGAGSGGGGLDLILGSAAVNINADPPVNAFGTFGGTNSNEGVIDLGNSTTGTPGIYSPGISGSRSVDGTSGTSNSSLPIGSTDGGLTGQPGAEPLGPIMKVSDCRSLSSVGGSCSGGGAALPVGFAALVFLLSTFAWDVVRQRRRSLIIGETL